MVDPIHGSLTTRSATPPASEASAAHHNSSSQGRIAPTNSQTLASLAPSNMQRSTANVSDPEGAVGETGHAALNSRCPGERLPSPQGSNTSAHSEDSDSFMAYFRGDRLAPGEADRSGDRSNIPPDLESFPSISESQFDQYGNVTLPPQQWVGGLKLADKPLTPQQQVMVSDVKQHIRDGQENLLFTTADSVSSSDSSYVSANSEFSSDTGSQMEAATEAQAATPPPLHPDSLLNGPITLADLQALTMDNLVNGPIDLDVLTAANPVPAPDEG